MQNRDEPSHEITRRADGGGCSPFTIHQTGVLFKGADFSKPRSAGVETGSVLLPLWANLIPRDDLNIPPASKPVGSQQIVFYTEFYC